MTTHRRRRGKNLIRRHYLLMGMVLFLSLMTGCTVAPVTGQLVDFRTNAPIAWATVTLVLRGWGISHGQLVWDRSYTASTQTGMQGEFSLRLPGPALLVGSGAGMLRVEAEGGRLRAGYAFGQDAIPVDTHAHRLANRMGLVRTVLPEQTESELMRITPKEHWQKVNDLFVHGKTTCKPRKPGCFRCVVIEYCDYTPKNMTP